MTFRYAVVVVTVGRAGLADLVRRADSEPRPQRIVIADDRVASSELLPPLALPATAAPLQVVACGGRGPAAARNAGWRAAVDADPELDWIAFLDDDVALPDAWNAHLTADLADLAPTVGGSQARPSTELGDRESTDDHAYRREALQGTGGFDERFPRAFRMDADLALRVVRAGWTLVRGDRRTEQRLRSESGWRAGLTAQAGNADDALLRVKYGPGWRRLIGARSARWGRHVLTTTAALAALGGLLARRPAVASIGGVVWTGLTVESAVRRFRPGPRTPAEIAAAVVTSAAIPPVALGWRLFGEAEVRLGRSRRRARQQPLAVLFDRDGTLIHNVPYLDDPAGVRPVGDARRALRRLRRRGVAVGVVSNQSGIARGLISPDALRQVNQRVQDLLGPFETFQVCPHGADDGCACRKPAPGMVLAAARELGVEPDRCVVIGDIGADVDAALAAGARAVLVPTRETRIAEVDRASVLASVAPTLDDAVRLTLAGHR